MKRLLLIAGGILPALMLGACTQPGGVGSAGTIPANGTPSTIATRTAADEQAMLRAEKAYKLSRTIGELLVDTGAAKGVNLVRLQQLDTSLYAALTTARAAYRAFNSRSLLEAVGNVDRLASEIDALAGGLR